MKSVYFLFLVLTASLLAAQNISNYTFTAGNSAYVNEPGTVVTLSSGNQNDGYVNSVDMGFDFWFMGTRYTHAGITTNGWMTLGTGSTAITNAAPANSFSVVNPNVARPIIAPLWDDLDFTESMGAISYTTSGIMPNRIFTVEWKNAEWGANTDASVISFKVKLYETSGKIAYQYLQGNAAVSGASASIGIGGSTNTIFQSINNSSASPSASTSISTNNINTLPASGQTYSFTPPVLPSPSNITFTNVTINSMTINWADNSSAETGYAIYMSPDNVNFYFAIRVNANVTSMNIGGLFTGTPYYYRIYTISEGSFSAAASANRSTLNGTLSGTYTIPGNYPTINAAINAVLANGVSSKVVFELQVNYTGAGETYPINIPTNLGNTADKPITLRPAANVSSVSISGSSTSSVITFNGAKYFIIDGRPGGTGTTKALKIYNSYIPSTQPSSSLALSFVNDACNDTVRYCDVLSEGFSVVSIGGTTAGVGNSNNSIDHCLLRGGLSSNTSDIFVSAGTAGKQNSSNTIAFNEIYDFAPQTTMSGPVSLSGTNVINIGSYCTDYRIINNHIYQPQAASSFSSNFFQVGISFSNSSGKVTIRNNYIGGSAPLCGGSPWEFGPSSTSNTIVPIRVISSSTEPSLIEGNTISNFILATSGSVNPFPGYDIAGISVSGLCKVKNNTIGSSSAAGSFLISLSSQGGVLYASGISASSSSDSIINNSIGGIKITSSGTARINYTGIQGAGQVIAENLVGSMTTANSIWINSIAQQHTLTGISGYGTITGNMIVNLNNPSAQNGTIYGINASYGTISGNTISKLKSSSTTANGLTGVNVQVSGSNTARIIKNTIHSLSSVSGTDICGILLTSFSAGTFEISQNSIHSFEYAGAGGPAYILSGIRVTGNSSINNNMIRLGLNPDGSSITAPCSIYGIYNQGGGSGEKRIVHNSIYIGGNNVASGTAASACFQSPSSSGASVSFYNNVMCNARSNTSTGGVHYLMNYFDMASDNNVFYTYGAPFAIAAFTNQYTSFNAYKTGRSKDLNSSESDPKFISPAGSAITGDLHIQSSVPTWVEGHGNNAYSTLLDFDGESRSSPADIGADAGNFTGIPVKWLSFDAKPANNNEVLLTWQTASEKNNKQFDVERSFDGVHFVYLNSVKGNGNTNAISRYQYTDVLKNAGISSTIYYRLKQIDFNGEFEYSWIRIMNTDVQNKGAAIEAYPNPFTDHIAINPGNYPGVCMVKITDSFGRLMGEHSFTANAQGDKFLIHTAEFTSGLYLIKITDESGVEKTIKLVK
ncbi:MAG: fibronectin type III domain-containing protein [Bacteroidota bacterium]